MTLKAVLFDFNGVIINDEALHQQLIEEILLEENIRPNSSAYREICLGRSDRACLTDLLTQQGRLVTDEYIDALIQRKSKRYLDKLATLDPLPIYPGVADALYKFKAVHLKIGLVSGALREEIQLVLERGKLLNDFSVIVSADDIQTSKPDPDGYLLAVDRFNADFPDLTLVPSDCLVLEDTPAGITAAKRAGMSVVGVANTYPFHMMQRQANWTVDYLTELEIERIQRVFEGHTSGQTAA
ncbi:MAG: HAD family phosphatase [Leptolyngbyaceae bacterium]|nr:HAD family phosphatase [Leptolyngbyaceae bacterium]